MNLLEKHHRKSSVISFIAIIMLFGSIILSQPTYVDAASLKVSNQYNPSYGIEYKSSKYAKRNVNILEMDIADAFTEVQLGKPDPLDKLMTVKNRANTYDRSGNKIVGAINANFFQMSKRRPVHLISEDNRLVYAGHINKNSAFVTTPLAFGINAKGKGLISDYNSKVTYTYKGKNHGISHLNKERDADRMILYTKDFQKSKTDTNDWGTEVILTGSKNTELTLGSKIKLEVKDVRKKGSSTIPKNGLVLSGHGKRAKELNKMKVGDTVEVNVKMDKKWQGSEFMLAGGPQLVKGGKVNNSMNIPANSMNSSSARTVVGIDKSGEKVFFVTVDSPGLPMKKLAQLMKNMGAYTALNLDGGGSTTMVTLPKGGKNLKVVNNPSDPGGARGVSGILMAADTEPKRIFSDVSYRSSHAEGIHWLHDIDGITGYPDNTFDIGQNLSRQHSALIFTRTLGYEKPAAEEVESIFKDIKASHLYAQEIAAVGQESLFTGSQGDFMPEETLTREQMASTLVRAFGFEKNPSKKKDINLKKVDPSHKESVQILADNGITTELDNFRPREAVTRGQFASFLYRATQINQ